MCAAPQELTQLRHAVATYSAAGVNISGAAGIWLPPGKPALLWRSIPYPHGLAFVARKLDGTPAAYPPFHVCV